MTEQFTPKIATHWTPGTAKAGLELITAQASQMTDDETTAKAREHTEAAEEIYSRVGCWDTRCDDETRCSLSSSCPSRIFRQTGNSWSEMAAIWCQALTRDEIKF